MLRLLLLLLVLLPFTSTPQNLVVNPGFEVLKPKATHRACVYTSQETQFTENVQGWNTFLGSTPDFIIIPDDSTDCIYPRPYQGNKMAGIILYHPSADSGYDYDYHEFIQGSLKSPLVPGQHYRIEIWIQQGNKTAIDHLNSLFSKKALVHPGACNNLGIMFQTRAENPKMSFRKIIKDFNLKPHINFDKILETKEGEWVKISTTFVPSRPFQYFVIGNFYSDFRTKTTIQNSETIGQANSAQSGFYKKKKRIAYYCLDEISISKFDPAKELPPEERVENAFKKTDTYIFQNVHFETNKWTLQEEALAELNALAEYLNKHPEVKIEIGGHTDNVGSPGDNATLSENRAKSVYQFLQKKVSNPDRLSFIGYGEEIPIGDNETEEGRLQNRRVECKVME